MDFCIGTPCFWLFGFDFDLDFGLETAEGVPKLLDEYVQSLLCVTMASLQTTWFLRGRKESPEQLYTYLQEYGQILGRTLIPDFPK